VETSTGITLTARRGLEALQDADTVVVPGWDGWPSDSFLRAASALARAHLRGARVCRSAQARSFSPPAGCSMAGARQLTGARQER
jgi:hypothetical protein